MIIILIWHDLFLIMMPILIYHTNDSDLHNGTDNNTDVDIDNIANIDGVDTDYCSKS